MSAIEQLPEGEYALPVPEPCVVCGETIQPTDQPRWYLPERGGSAHDGCYSEPAKEPR